MADEWGPLVKHSGGPCPVPPETWVWVRIEGQGDRFQEGEIRAGDLRIWDWTLYGTLARPGGTWGKIVAYRLRRPPAIQKLVDLVEGLPEPVREDAQ